MNELSKFLRERLNLNYSRFHMPGHAGRCFFLNSADLAKLDFTEIEGADFLYEPGGIISALEKEISCLYGANSIISTGGSTLSIQTIVCSFKSKKFIAMKSSHVAFYNVCSLLGIEPVFVCSSGDCLFLEIEKYLARYGDSAAVFVTSPNYCGVSLDVSKLSELCKKYGAILIVDNAHGAHLKFLEQDVHPISLGADICCDSFHKTLPALTGASVIHYRDGLIRKEDLKFNMSLFGTTSPSYIIMDSIGLCVDWLKKSGRKSFIKLEKRVKLLKEKFSLKFLETDCSKIALECCNLNICCEDLKKIFADCLIEPEFVGEKYIVLILSPFLNEIDFYRLKKCLKILELYVQEKEDVDVRFDENSGFEISLKEAIFGEFEKVESKKSLGKICARNVFGSLPGTLEIVAGEKITENKIDWLVKNNIEEVYVVKNQVKN